MASNETDTLFETFQQAAGDQLLSDSASLFASSIGTTLDELMNQAGELATGGSQSSGSGVNESSGSSGTQSSSNPGVINVSAEAGSRAYTSPTTYAVYPNSSGGSGGSGGSSILSLATSALGGGLGIIPLVTGLMGLFGGSSEPPPLEKYIMPDQLWLTGADTANGIQDADYDQYGMPRLYSDSTSGTSQQLSSSLTTSSSSGGSSTASSPINVTIQAMDSQSFLDRSSDIAQAVRQAMLTSNSINDVVNNDI